MMMRMFAAVCAVVMLGSVIAVPNYQGCLTAKSKTMKYCDTSLSFSDRVDDMISRMSTADLISLTGPDPANNTCNNVSPAVDSIDLPRYMWLVETNTGVAAACPTGGSTACSTTFIGPNGLAASFNRSSWSAKGTVMSTEMRAYSNNGGYRGQGSYYLNGANGFGPNINQPRDPRFGRSSELPGEDPYLAGQYGLAFGSAMEVKDSKGFKKMTLGLKHYNAYSMETNRAHTNAIISAFDEGDTYLRQYNAVLSGGVGSGVMCSYTAVNGIPSCSSSYLTHAMRVEFGQTDAYVMTDCGAINNMRGGPDNAPSDQAAAAWAINNGTDLEAGSTLFTHSMGIALAEKLTNIDTIKAAVRRLLLNRMNLGLFDPPESVSWTSIPISTVGSADHIAVSYDAALQSFTLLKNDANTLPLTAGKTVAVLGPMATSGYSLLSDYYGDDLCLGGGFDCIETIGDAMTKANVGGTTLVEQGVDINSSNSSGVAAALAAAAKADSIVLAMGIDKTVEHEGVDRVNISLPGLQESFVRQVLALKLPTTLVLVNGGPLAIDGLTDGLDAIVEAYNPSMQGASALAATLFGTENRWGKLPYTMYARDYVKQVALDNYDMSKAPGRTYRYYTGKPVFEFGQGLSYTTFSMGCELSGGGGGGGGGDGASSFPIKYSCSVKNTGERDGDEVVMVYHQAGSAMRSAATYPVPVKSLVEFSRVHVKAGSTATVSFSLGEDSFALTDSTGSRAAVSGSRNIIFSRGNGQDVVIPVTL